ncbi:hypothetical protein EVAR_22382_1 [Eumeta japonica]|uniref:Uncharacterized protein n=1 Tax=Eumeta variegata TaxID=151549 RepID=A0A4C1VJH6_EUMVA|nr:hypothetical protein EVAR_22382_1 [Eumeta japonica]
MRNWNDIKIESGTRIKSESTKIIYLNRGQIQDQKRDCSRNLKLDELASRASPGSESEIKIQIRKLQLSAAKVIEKIQRISKTHLTATRTLDSSAAIARATCTHKPGGPACNSCSGRRSAVAPSD